MTMRFTLEQLPPRHRQQVERQIKAELKYRSEPKPPRKYRNQPVEAAGEKFDSKHEEREFRKLEARQAAGEIRDLRRQVKFSLFDPGEHCRGEHIGTYTADFVWREVSDGLLRVGDAKSKKTVALRDWKRTKALFKACHGHEIIEFL